MRIRAILFDLDQTLVDREATFFRFALGQWNRFSEILFSVEPELYCQTLAEYSNNGYTSIEQVYEKACAHFDLAIAPQTLAADFRERYGFQPALFDDARPLLEELQRSYRLGIATNGRSRSQRAKIAQSSIGRFFHTIAISEEVGFKKPAREIYVHCLESLGFSPEETLCVGDNPELDVTGPRRLGMKAVWLRNRHFPAPAEHDGIIDRLSDLPELLRLQFETAT